MFSCRFKRAATYARNNVYAIRCAKFSSQQNSSGSAGKWVVGIGVPLLSCGAFYLYNSNSKPLVKEAVKEKVVSPTITIDQMREMVEKDDRIVVSFRGNVYDVTDFTGHPGGYGRLQMAAGHDLEVFWRVYTQHNRGHIEDLLSRYKIGELSEQDSNTMRNEFTFDNPYNNDPPPSPNLLTNTRFPYNAEGKIQQLREQWVTPVGKHFVRNHSAVPDIDPEDYTLTISGE